MTIDYKALGAKIKEYRKKENITQEQLAEMADISLSHMSNIETASASVSLPALKLIADALDVTLDELLIDSYSKKQKEYLSTLGPKERKIAKDELKDFAEAGLCGTAAVISPVGKIVDHGKEICFPSGMNEMGPITKKLYETLTGIQMGRIQAPEGWLKVIE